MRALVTGATGFLGSNLVRRLRSDGAQVRILVRSAARAHDLIALGAEPVIGDITDPAAVSAALDGVNTVFHLAGRLFVPGTPESEYRRTHVEGTRTLLARVTGHATLQRFVHCSTTGVLGITGDQPADEGAPWQPTNAYEATKADAERAVRTAMQHGLPAVIVRPGLVYGPGDLHLLGFFRAIMHRRFRPIGRRPVWLHPIYIDDMSDALVRCATHPAAIGECFHIAGRTPVTLDDLASTIARAEGTSLPAGRIPMPAARAAAAAGDLLPARLRHAAPLTRTRLDFLTHSRVYDVSKAERLLGFAAATDLSTGIAKSVSWYRDHAFLPNAAAA